MSENRESLDTEVQGNSSYTNLVVPVKVLVQVRGQEANGQSNGESIPLEATIERVVIDKDYSNREGYQDDFLGASSIVPLPRLTGNMRFDAAINRQPLATGPKYVLPYHKYSVVMCTSRRLAFFAAVNIDGNKLVQYDRSGDQWHYDERIPQDAQVGNELYYDNPYDRGHLVRRRDACWGDTEDEAVLGNNDTFHFTNCSPQHWFFNQKETMWLGLEKYILDNAELHEKRVCIFNGPIFRNDDPVHRGVKIPRAYWKVAVIKKKDKSLSATGYIINQDALIADIQRVDDFQYGAFLNYQTSIERIETLTGLNFGYLSNYDPRRNDPSATPQAVAQRGTTLLHDLSEIQL